MDQDCTAGVRNLSWDRYVIEVKWIGAGGFALSCRFECLDEGRNGRRSDGRKRVNRRRAQRLMPGTQKRDNCRNCIGRFRPGPGHRRQDTQFVFGRDLTGKTILKVPAFN